MGIDSLKIKFSAVLLVTQALLIAIAVSVNFTSITTHYEDDADRLLAYLSETQASTTETVLQFFLHQLSFHGKHSSVVAFLTQGGVGEKKRALRWLSSFKIQGSAYPIVVLNFQGRVVHSTLTGRYDDQYDQSRWVDEMLSGKRSQHVSLDKEGEITYIELAVPILYNGSPEGLIILHLPTKLLLNTNNAVDPLMQCGLINHDSREKMFTSKSDKARHSRALLDSKNIFLICNYLEEGHEQMHEQILWRIVAMMSLFVLVNILILWLGIHYWVLSPVEMLKDWCRRVAYFAPMLIPSNSKLSIEFQSLISEMQQLYNRLQSKAMSASLERHLYQTVLEVTPLPLLVVDLQGAIIFTNQPLAEIINYRPDDLKGHQLDEFASAGSSVLQLLKEQGELAGQKLIFSDRWGKEVPLLFQGSLLFNLRGTVGTHAIFIKIDDPQKAKLLR